MIIKGTDRLDNSVQISFILLVSSTAYCFDYYKYRLVSNYVCVFFKVFISNLSIIGAQMIIDELSLPAALRKASQVRLSDEVEDIIEENDEVFVYENIIYRIIEILLLLPVILL